ncbi:MAG: Hint domain-containing protein [Polyangiaceae bacterium]
MTKPTPSIKGTAEPVPAAPEVKAPAAAEKPPPKTQPEPASPRGGGCFVAGTLVLTERGWQNIEDVRAGDLVLSMPDDGDENGEPVWRRVEAAYERTTAIIDLTIEAPDGTTAVIGTTHEHPFWIGGRGWTRAEDIRPDDYVWSVERGWLWVRSVHERPEEEPVYNVRVAEDHTYFVSNVAVWVHNADDCPPVQRAGHNGFEGPVAHESRITRQGETAVRQTFPDGSVKDISPRRVKEFVPNPHPKAPAGSLNKVKFPDAQPGTKGFKRDPTPAELKEVQ